MTKQVMNPLFKKKKPSLRTTDRSTQQQKAKNHTMMELATDWGMARLALTLTWRFAGYYMRLLLNWMREALRVWEP